MALNKLALNSVNTPVHPQQGLDPYFVTGFCDAESCFYISITPGQSKELSKLTPTEKGTENTKTEGLVRLIFKIKLHKKDRALLDMILSFFGVGNITKAGEDYIQFRVTSIKDLEKIINFFDGYPLITQK